MFASCAQTPLPARLERVAARDVPRPMDLEKTSTIVVYSAFEVGPLSATDAEFDRPRHTDYEVLSSTGSLATRVKNRVAPSNSEPARVMLEPGQYRVVAVANRFGYVDIPVTLAPATLLVIRLDGEPPPVAHNSPHAYDLVRIPNGKIAGWSMVTPATL